MECPLEKGPVQVTKEFSMPEEIPNVSSSPLVVHIGVREGELG
jgi:hypothetical protein